MEKKKQKKVKDNGEKKDRPKGQENVEAQEEKPYDFGGLPDRDLKKNLGCGG